MTVTLDGDYATFYINNPGPNINDAPFTLRSQYSQEVIFTDTQADVGGNQRYATVVVNVPSDIKDKHLNGYYTWTLGDFYSDIVKIITKPGGDEGKVEYISNNEERDAEVFYRPNY